MMYSTESILELVTGNSSTNSIYGIESEVIEEIKQEDSEVGAFLESPVVDNDGDGTCDVCGNEIPEGTETITETELVEGVEHLRSSMEQSYIALTLLDKYEWSNEGVMSNLKEGVKKVWEMIKKVWTSVYNFVAGFIKRIFQWIKKRISKSKDTGTQMVKMEEQYPKLTEALKDGTESLSEAIVQLRESKDDVTNSILDRHKVFQDEILKSLKNIEQNSTDIDNIIDENREARQELRNRLAQLNDSSLTSSFESDTIERSLTRTVKIPSVLIGNKTVKLTYRMYSTIVADIDKYLNQFKNTVHNLNAAQNKSDEELTKIDEMIANISIPKLSGIETDTMTYNRYEKEVLDVGILELIDNSNRKKSETDHIETKLQELLGVIKKILQILSNDKNSEKIARTMKNVTKKGQEFTMYLAAIVRYAMDMESTALYFAQTIVKTGREYIAVSRAATKRSSYK